ncbi:hypothetical protein OGAPHI_007043 [Ogataea philodendri]|uniref:Enhancer of mRNA-decapping protein 3 n=1 Tax=Ogataea philodendri TaxID=1378263 RepID=A0A9P8NVZ3_9ASCO|nr:uncharacterized protein OGAPHI_007043 [Ogataea philodendri]KAH3660457.1 hypothetical protein OGAPHI_007043 [Ogataea philodendri]
MSQFCGYTLEIELNDAKGTKVKGTIGNIQDKDLLLSEAQYLQGPDSNSNHRDLLIKEGTIKDLKVVGIPPRKKKDKKKSKQEKDKDKYSETKALKKESTLASGKADCKGERVQSTQDPDNHYNYHSNEIDWQNENPGTLKNMEVFDFASNLQKFDKKSVFEELSRLDKTDPRNRLVGQNKLPQKTNYENTEMVLQSSQKDTWENINSANDYTQSALGNQANEKIKEQETNLTKGGVQQTNQLSSVIKSNVKIYSLEKDLIPTCSPIQLAEIIQLCSKMLGVSNEAMIYDAGRSLAELIVKEIIGEFRLSNLNHNAPPLVLVLAGNNVSGARVLTAGKQLSNHGIRVLAYVLHDSEESEDEMLDIVKSSLNILTSTDGKIVKSIPELNHVLEQVDSPLELIIDGLQGYDTNLCDLIEPELSRSKNIVEWCNNSKAPVLSLDVPSGLEASSGTADFETYIASNYLVSVGIPLSSVLSLYRFGYFEKQDLKHFLIDSGIPRKVFTLKSNLRKFDRYWFTKSWYAILNVE